MMFVVERFEKELAILEKPDASLIALERALLPSEAREGDVLIGYFDGAGELIALERDPKQTQARLDKAKLLRAQLPKAADGDFEL